MQFGNDWPGVFIRGDNAFHYAKELIEVLETSDASPIQKAVLEGLARTLAGCNAHVLDYESLQMMSSYEECRPVKADK